MMGTNMNCRCICRCTVVSLIVSAILGVIAAFLQFAGLIAITVPLLAAAFVVAVVFLIVLAAALILKRGGAHGNCLCSVVYTLLAGIAGTVLVSVLLLITGIAGGVFGSILGGLLVFFFALLIAGTLCLIVKETECDNR